MENMTSYLGVKLLKARPMTRGEYNVYRGWELPSDENGADEGYLVQYEPDGYESWSPKAQFDAAYLPLVDGTKISESDIDVFIGPDAVEASQVDEKTTLVKMVPRTGFVQYETSSCVDPENYAHELGVSIATERIKDRIWPMLGFVLQWGKSGLK